MLRIRSPQVADSAAGQLQIAGEVLKQESVALAAVADRLDQGFVDAVGLLSECAGNVIVTGMGKAGHVGRKVAATLASTGTRAFFLHPAEALHGDLGRVRDGDVVVAFSHGGETSELRQILQAVGELETSLIAVTSRGSSSLAQRADARIIYGEVAEACPVGLAPSTSCAVMMAIGDALAFVLMELRGFGSSDFGKLHPAGSLGRKLQRVEEIMRKGSQLRIAEEGLSVSEAFVRVQMPGRRTGAIILVDPSGKLTGMFTDSDLARLFEQRNFSLFDRPIAEFMTRRPTTMHRGERVLDALTKLRDRHISEIPVLDDDDRPVGIVDITDLVDLMPDAADAA